MTEREGATNLQGATVLTEVCIIFSSIIYYVDIAWTHFLIKLFPITAAGNCDGLGGVFGMIHSIGGSLPFPEGKPWKPSLEWEAFAKHIPEIEKAWGTDRYKTN